MSNMIGLRCTSYKREYKKRNLSYTETIINGKIIVGKALKPKNLLGGDIAIVPFFFQDLDK